MLRVLKWILLIPALLVLGYAAADMLNMATSAARLTGVDAAACGARPNPDWESVNPFGCRYRFNLAPSEFEQLQREQLTAAHGWEAHAPQDVHYPALTEVAGDESRIYTNHDLPTRVRWVVYNPQAELLYLGYYMH